MAILHHKLNMNTNLTLAFFFTSIALFSFLLIFSQDTFLITPKQRLNSIPENSLFHELLVQETQHQVPDDQDTKYTKLLPPTIGEEKCDLFKGHWVPEPRGPMYNRSSCATLPNWQNCLENGRTDKDFLHWRWKPDSCELPQFDPDNFLEFVRGKTMAFVGDSLAQGHVDSLLCLLSQEESPKEIYNDSEDRSGKWYFPQHNFTLMKIWSRHLIAANERMVYGTEYSGLFDLHLDKIDDKWGQHLPDLDYFIISGGHWFSRVMYLHQSGKLTGCVDCNQPNVTNYPRSHAVRMTFRTALKNIRVCSSCKRDMLTLLRTFSPAHFENGAWNTGGYCNRTSPFNEFEADVNNFQSEWEVRGIQIEELERARKEAEEEQMPAAYGRKKFGVLDVTRAMMMRPDGHIGDSKYNPRLRTDCLHWCMPGPIDYWNNFLLEIIQKDGG